MLAVRARRARELAATVPQVRDAAEGPPAATAPPCWSPSSSAAPSATPRPSSVSLRDDVLGPEHLARGVLTDDERAEAADVLADAALGYWAAEVLPPLSAAS